LTGLRGQTFGGAERVPVAKGLRGGDANLGRGDHAPGGLNVRQGVDLLAAIEAQNGAADEEERHIGADLGGDFQPRVSSGKGCPNRDELRAHFARWGAHDPDPQLRFQPHQRRHGIGRAGAQAALHRQPLFDVDFDLGVRPSAFSASSTIFQAVLRLSVGTRLSFEVRRIVPLALAGGRSP
jgi:hypothetical protein